jgi:hypothetical protein
MLMFMLLGFGGLILGSITASGSGEGPAKFIEGRGLLVDY